MKTILFQGDSITDCGRTLTPFESFGDGYPLLVYSKLGYEKPNEFNFINRGISGNRIVDIYARMKADITYLKPDYMSLLIGVNDVWHDFGDCHNGVSAEKFEKIYTMLLEEIFEVLPNIKIMIFLPYVLEGDATKSTDEEPDRWDNFKTEVKKRAEAAKRVAEKFGLPYVALQEKFDAAAKLTGDTKTWTPDGVHPSHAGHELIAREWLELFNKIQ